MSRQPTEDLVQELTRDLPPVRPMLRVRVALVGLLLLWGVVVGLDAWLGGAQLSLSWSDPIHFGVLLGLAVTAGGATLSALAGAVPGRERVGALGRVVSALGLALLIGFALWGWGAERAGSEDSVLAGSFGCLSHATLLALPPLLVAFGFLLRGVALSPSITAGAAAAGAVGLGAFAVHATCPMTGGLHVLLGHCLAPIFAAGLFALPLAAIIRHRSRFR